MAQYANTRLSIKLIHWLKEIRNKDYKEWGVSRDASIPRIIFEITKRYNHARRTGYTYPNDKTSMGSIHNRRRKGNRSLRTSQIRY